MVAFFFYIVYNNSVPKWIYCVFARFPRISMKHEAIIMNMISAKSLSDVVREALEPEKVNFLGLKVNPSLFTAFGVSAFLILAALSSIHK